MMSRCSLLAPGSHSSPSHWSALGNCFVLYCFPLVLVILVLRCLGSSQYHPVIHPLFAVLLHVLLSVCCCSLRFAFHLLAASSFHTAPRLRCPSQFRCAVSAAPYLSHFCAIWIHLCPLHSLPFWYPLVAPRRLPRSTSPLLHSIPVTDHIWSW